MGPAAVGVPCSDVRGGGGVGRGERGGRRRAIGEGGRGGGS